MRAILIKNTGVINKLLHVIIVLGLPLLFVSCTKAGSVSPETRYLVLDRGAPVPPGAIRYCWEEPMVEIQPNGPGLDGDGIWYHPAYMAVRQVRDGRWRPCRDMPSEVEGETRNER